MGNVFDEIHCLPQMTKSGELVTYKELRFHSYDEFDHALIDAARIEAARKRNKENGVRFDR